MFIRNSYLIYTNTLYQHLYTNTSDIPPTSPNTPLNLTTPPHSFTVNQFLEKPLIRPKPCKLQTKYSDKIKKDELVNSKNKQLTFSIDRILATSSKSQGKLYCLLHGHRLLRFWNIYLINHTDGEGKEVSPLKQPILGQC